MSDERQQTMRTTETPDTHWESLAKMLPSPLRLLHGKRASPEPQADNLVCFCRRSASELNHPQRGRALHHRCVLILSIQTSATVCVDDRAIRLNAGEGLLVLPFQFHDYIAPERQELLWTFMTFEVSDISTFQPLRYRPFKIDDGMRLLICDLIAAYLEPGHDDLAIAMFRVLLARIRLAKPIDRCEQTSPVASGGFITQINQLAQAKGGTPTVKEIAAAIGVSESHLRARFRASCGVSLGHHLRRLQMEKACGLLRLSTNRVTEISELCGFSSVFSFSRAFRTAYGLSPLAYRRAGSQRDTESRATS